MSVCQTLLAFAGCECRCCAITRLGRRGQRTAEASLKSSRAAARSRPREPEFYDSAASSSEASASGQAQHDVEAAEALVMPTASGPSLEAHAPAVSAGASTSHSQPQVRYSLLVCV